MKTGERSRIPEDGIAAIAGSGLHAQVVHLVANGVRGDSRVIKSAQASMSSNRSSLVIGITNSTKFECFVVEGVPVLLVPFEPRHGVSEEATRPRVLREWTARARDISRLRAVRSAKARRPALAASQAVRGASLRAREPVWSQFRPDALDINLAFAQALESVSPEFIHIHDAFPLPSGVAYASQERLRARRHVQVMYDAHECVTELARSDPSSTYFAALSSIEREYIRDATRVITVSEQIASLLTYTYGLKRMPSVIRNGPKGERDLGAPNLRRRLGLADEIPLAVYSGWVAAERGLGTVLRAMPSIPELNLALVVNRQSGGLISALRVAHELGVSDRVHLAPYVSPSEITQYLSSADVGLIPLHSGRHLDLSLPTKFREYTHAGLPMVVSNNVAMADEIKRTGIGRVFRAGNVAGLVLQLERVLSEPERYTSRITPGLLEKYSWESQVKQLIRMYSTVSPPMHDGCQPAIQQRLFASVQCDGRGQADIERTTWAAPHAEYFGVKLGIGGTDHEGQARAWAKAVSRQLGIPAQSFGPKTSLGVVPHVIVPGRATVPQATEELGRILGAYTYLIFNGFASLLGKLTRFDMERELSLFELHMFRIGLIAHENEVRDPDAHIAQLESSRYKEMQSVDLIKLRETSRKNRKVASRFQGPVFVSTPDLLSDLPFAHWLPLVVDMGVWNSLDPAVFGPKLRVLYRHDKNTVAGRRSSIVHDVLLSLDNDGVIEYLHASHTTDPIEILELVAQADVIVDQFGSGSYGREAIEAMAAGRVVVGNILPIVHEVIGEPLPIIETSSAGFEVTIRKIASTNRDELRALAYAGVAFATRLHNGDAAAESMRQYLLAELEVSSLELA